MVCGSLAELLILHSSLSSLVDQEVFIDVSAHILHRRILLKRRHSTMRTPSASVLIGELLAVDSFLVGCIDQAEVTDFLLRVLLHV